MDMGAVVALIKGLVPKANPAVIEQAVSDWLDDHPEATTTVEDGSITEAKLAADVAGILDDLQDDVTDVENAIQGIEDTESDHTVEGSFAYLVYETLGLYVDENGDICQKEDVV